MKSVWISILYTIGIISILNLCGYKTTTLEGILIGALSGMIGLCFLD